MNKPDEIAAAEPPLECVVRDHPMDCRALERAVMADRQRPCLYGVAGPCVHPKCLEAHYETLRSNGQK